MGRPPKKGLDYFSLDVDIFDNHKVEDLLAEYGCKGFTVYICILAEVYKSGYYLEMPPERLAVKCMKQVGGGWLKKNFVLDVIHSCGELGLFDNALLLRGVITSPGIQRRYAEVTARNKVQKEKYWLLDTVQKGENPEGLLKSPIKHEYVTEKGVSVAETKFYDAEMTQKKRKENIYTLPIKSKKGYGDYGHVFLAEEERQQLDADYGPEEAWKRIAMLDTWMEQRKDYRSDNHYLTITKGWVDRRIAEDKSKRNPQKKKPGSQWKDFDQRSIDYDALLREVTGN